MSVFCGLLIVLFLIHSFVSSFSKSHSNLQYSVFHFLPSIFYILFHCRAHERGDPSGYIFLADFGESVPSLVSYSNSAQQMAERLLSVRGSTRSKEGVSTHTQGEGESMRSAVTLIHTVEGGPDTRASADAKTRTNRNARGGRITMVVRALRRFVERRAVLLFGTVPACDSRPNVFASSPRHAGCR